MNEITDELAHSIRRLLINAGLIDYPQDWSIEPASGGLNSRVFFAGRRGGQPVYTVRLSIPDKQSLIGREGTLLEALQGHCSCAPELLLFSETGLVEHSLLLVHTFVAGNTVPLDSASLRQLQALGRCLAQIHATGHGSYTIWPDLQPRSGTRAEAIQDRTLALERYSAFDTVLDAATLESMQHMLHQIRAIPPPGQDWDATTFTQLHGDLSLGNIVWDDDRVTLIDWEYARLGDPAEDLAYLFAEQDVAAERRAILIDSYVAAGGKPATVARADTYAALVSLDSALWWAEHALQNGLQPAQSREVAFHLQRATAALRALDLSDR